MRLIRKSNREIPGPFQFYSSLQKPGPSVLLESLGDGGELARYSFVGSRPFLQFRAEGESITLTENGRTKHLRMNPWQALKLLLERFRTRARGKFPMEHGCAVGYLGYEMKNYSESAAKPPGSRGAQVPTAYFLFFKDGWVFDRVQSSARDKFPPVSCQIRPEISRSRFMAMVRRAQTHIRRGDIYQINLSQRIRIRTRLSALAIYERLRSVNPSAFFGFLDAGDFQIVSGSPERLLRLHKGILETRPIAGTRSRGKTLREDRTLSRELFLNEKERAEHVMLVDLERNDLGRVCRYGTVHVDEFMALENYSHVKHIVSNVKGRMRPDVAPIDALREFFPGGTITGVPKVRCMQIIKDLEPFDRGPYTGSLGYFDFAGDMDFNILIRSLVCRGSQKYLQVGSGIVADSIPEREYEETLHKACAVVEAIGGARLTSSFLRGR